MTIVILIILAVISINAVFGEDGLLASAERGSIEHTHAMVWEAMEMEYSNYWIDKVMLGGNLITYLQGEDKGIIGKELQGAGYVINVEKLLGTRMSLGNGTDGTNDVYKLEPLPIEEANITKVASTEKSIKLAEESTKIKKEYRVKYYGPSGDRVLGILGDNIINLTGSDNPQDPQGPEYLQEKTKFIICNLDQDGMPLIGTVIDIYTDESCSEDSFYETIDFRENAIYDHSDDIPPVGKYYIKGNVTPDGYNQIVMLEVEITDELYQRWDIINNQGETLPEWPGVLLRIWTDANEWNIGLGGEDAGYYDDIINYGSSTTMHIYRFASVDNSGNITYTDAISGIRGLPTKYSDFYAKYFKNFYTQEEFVGYICEESGVENLNDVGLESYLDINLEKNKELTTVKVPRGKELKGKIDLFIISCDNILTQKYEYNLDSTIIYVENEKINMSSMSAEQSIRSGRLEIETEVLDYASDKPSTIVYEVEAEKDGYIVYANVVRQIVNNSGKQTVVLENIPSSTTVTVKQIYSGTLTRCISDYIQQSNWDYLDEGPICNVSFKNSYIKSQIKGGSIQNNFEYLEADGIWQWNKENEVNDNDVLSLQEEFYDWTKHVLIESNENNEPMYIRAIAFCPSNIELVYSGEMWTQGDEGYYYYSDVLGSGEATTELNIQIWNVPVEYVMEGEQFNVIVVYEAVPVLYTEEGEAYADWTVYDRDYDENIEY